MSDHYYKILSLDGGGIRGLMSAIWLQRLEEKLKQINPEKSIYQYFDLIAGTSTGSILACAVANGKSAAEIIDLYKKRGNKIFPPFVSRLDKLFSTLNQITSPKYDGVELEKQLKDSFRNNDQYLTFGELKTRTMIMTYDTFRRQALVLKSWKPEHQHLAVWGVCKASSAAPTYFPAHELQIEESEVSLIDGGVVANNPTVYAISEGVRLNAEAKKTFVNLKNFVVVSLGTGRVTRRLRIDQVQNWGVVEWGIGTVKFAAPIIDILFDSSVGAVDYASKQLIDDSKYFRFQTDLETAFDNLDDATETNLNALSNLADDYLGKNSQQVKQIVDLLT